MNDRQLLVAFESCSLRLEQWDHKSHIRVAYIYLTRYGWNDALCRMIDGIKKLNAHLEIPENEGSGFHYTTTVAWLALVQDRMRGGGNRPDSATFLDRNQELLNKQILLDYYSKTVLFSPHAKKDFLASDLKPLPRLQQHFLQETL